MMLCQGTQMASLRWQWLGRTAPLLFSVKKMWLRWKVSRLLCELGHHTPTDSDRLSATRKLDNNRSAQALGVQNLCQMIYIYIWYEYLGDWMCNHIFREANRPTDHWLTANFFSIGRKVFSPLDIPLDLATLIDEDRAGCKVPRRICTYPFEIFFYSIYTTLTSFM